jgi:hypothetical protein
MEFTLKKECWIQFCVYLATVVLLDNYSKQNYLTPGALLSKPFPMMLTS